MTATPILMPGKGLAREGSAFQAAVGPRATANWHAVWALAVGMGLALILALLGSAPRSVVIALICGAAPGVMG